MSEDIIRLIFGYLFYYGAPIGMILVVFNKIKKLIVSNKKGYKKIEGKVVEYVKDTDEKYMNYQKDALLEKHPKFYEMAMNFVKKYNLNDSKVKNNRNEDPSYFALIEYEVDGKKYYLYNSVGTDYKGEIGINKKIKYDPKNPKDAMLVKDWSHILLIFVLIIVMLIGYGLINY